MKKEVTKWIQLAKEINSDRNEKNYNILFNIRPVKVFEDSVLKINQDERKLYHEFCIMFEKFNSRIIDSANYEAGSGRIVDSIHSITRVIYLIDMGYHIYLDSDQEEVENRDAIEESYYYATNILMEKRFAVYSYISPFQEKLHNLQMTQENFDQAMDFLVSLQTDEDILSEFESRANSDLSSRNDGLLTKNELTKILLDIIEENKLAFKINSFDWEDNIVTSINNIFSEIKMDIVDKKYNSEKQEITFVLKMFGKQTEVTINFGDGIKEFIKFINEVVKKNTDKTLFTYYDLINLWVIPVDKEIEKTLATKIFVDIF